MHLPRRSDPGGQGENFDGLHRNSHPDGTAATLARLALGTAGIVTHQQALHEGLGAGALQWQIATGGLHRVHDGVYAVGHKDLSDEAWMHAALAAGGPNSAISHWSALRHWRLLGDISLRPVHITVPREESYIRRDGICAHRPLELHPLDVTIDRTLRVTTVPRALLEMAPYLSRQQLALALHKAQVEHHMSLDALRAVMARAPRARGLKRLHSVAFGDVAPNKRERRFRRIIEQAGLPAPRMNVLLRTEEGSFLVDCLWEDQQLIYEVDDPSHTTALRMTGDRRRDAVLQDAGYRVRRVTDDDLHGAAAERLVSRLRRQLG